MFSVSGWTTAMLVTMVFLSSSGAYEGSSGDDPNSVSVRVAVEADAAIVDRFAGSGRWQRSGETHSDQKVWRIHAVRRDDGSVQAKLSAVGVPGMEDITIEGHIVGEEAFGVLLGDDGKQVTTFNAKISADGRSGSFILGRGESGTWEHDLPTRTQSEIVGAQPQREPEEP